MVFFPFPFGSSSATVAPGGSPGWNATGAAAHTWTDATTADTIAWTSTTTAPLRAWTDLVLNTYDSTYDIGANFSIVADEDFPEYAMEDRPLVVPPDSGYSSP